MLRFFYEEIINSLLRSILHEVAYYVKFCVRICKHNTFTNLSDFGLSVQPYDRNFSPNPSTYSMEVDREHFRAMIFYEYDFKAGLWR